jgi:hypothetical protein
MLTMTISENVKKAFVDYIMLQVYDDKYIDRKEEKKILEEGIKKGIGVEEGLAIIRQVAADKGLALEREAAGQRDVRKVCH